jgi:amino acid transporter
LLPFGRTVVLPIVNAAGSSLALVALIVCTGLLNLRLRRASPDENSRRTPGGLALVILATAGAAFVVFMAFRQAGRSTLVAGMPLEWVIFGIWLSLGAVFWIATRRSRKSISEQQRRERLLGSA